MPVEIRPLALNLLPDYNETHTDGSNQFIYSRFLIPHLYGFHGWAIWLDGDMLVRGDLAELWSMRRADKGVQVVQHDYQTKRAIKYLGHRNEDYPRKNWSSVILWNNAYWPNRVLTPWFIGRATGKFLHRFEWLTDDQIEPLPSAWNHLTMEYERRDDAKIYHYTLGIPAFDGYQSQEGGDEWRKTLTTALAPL